MATDVPLLSGYKRNFVLRRFLHTATGLKLFPGQTPAYSWFLRHIAQSSELRTIIKLKSSCRLAIWVTPPTISLGFSFLNIKPFYPAWLAGAAAVFVFCAAVQIFSGWRQSGGENERRENNLLLSEEAAIEWDGVAGPNTWAMLVPRRTKITVLLFSLLAAVISCLSCLILRYQVIRNFFTSQTSAVAVFIFCWLTVFVTLQSLVFSANSRLIPATSASPYLRIKD